MNINGLNLVLKRGGILNQKIKQDSGNIGRNTRETRMAQGIGQESNY